MKTFFTKLTEKTPKSFLGLIIPLTLIFSISLGYGDSNHILKIIVIAFLAVWINFEPEPIIEQTEKLIKSISKLFI